MKTSIALPLLCAATLAAAPNLIAQTAGWQPLLSDPVADPQQFRSFVSLTFNASGNPVLAYSDYANGRMKLATRTGSTWAFETIGNDYGAVSLVMDGSDKPTFAWANGGLNFSAKSGTKWSTTTLDRGNISRYTAPSLAYNAGSPAISYRWNDSNTEGLKFAWRTGSTWRTQLVDAKVVGAYWTWDGWSSLAFNSSTGQFIIAYTEDENDDASIDALKIAKGVGTSWTTSFVEQNIANYSGACSLAFDPAWRPVIADCANGSVRLLRQQSDGTWNQQLVDTGSVANLAVSPVGKACIAYFDNGQLKVANTDLPPDPEVAANWTVQTADADGTASGTPAIKLANVGDSTSHVAYFGGTTLRLAKENPTYPGASDVFHDSMENSITTWNTEGARNDSTPRTKPPGPSTGNALWHQTTRRGTDAGHSAITSWYYGIDAQNSYSTNTRNWGRLISESISLPVGTRAELKVSQLVLAEGGSYENGEIQISVNGGAWATVFKRASRTDASFITDTVDFSAYLNKTIRIGFFVDTKDGTNNQYEGWYVDDVSVKWWP